MTKRPRRVKRRKSAPRSEIRRSPFRLGIEILEGRVCPSAFYDYEVVAQTGMSGIVSILPTASINDSGIVAFVASNSVGQSVYMSGVSGPQIVSFPTPSSTVTFGSELQINNANKVGAVDNVS